jgi:23S rRNA (cytidine1920-2'-O)/16S rRNA (cytidine1409-2'-O)-methyltransferase
MSFVSRAGQKLQHALTHFAVDVTGLTCADLGCSTGGFTDCLLKNGAARVYAVDTGYGVLDWNLRNDKRVITLERTNAMHVSLPEAVDLVTIDVAWTRQRHILPSAKRLLKRAPQSRVIALIKPHYEANAPLLRNGVLPDQHQQAVLTRVLADIVSAGFESLGQTESPVRNKKGNREWLAILRTLD